MLTLSAYDVRIKLIHLWSTSLFASLATRGTILQDQPALPVVRFIPTASSAQSGRYALSAMLQGTGSFETAHAPVPWVSSTAQESASFVPLSISPA